MGLTASLDIGSEKMAMAVAGVDNRGDCHLTGIKMIASQGVKEGVITDKAKVKSYVQYLLRELVRDKQVNVLNVSLSGKALRMGEQRVSVSLQRKTVKEADLVRAENKSIEQVKEIFLTVFLFAHGYASIIANNSLVYDEELIKSHLERAYRGAVLAVQEEKVE